MTKMTPPDERARRKIEAELDKNFLVEAGAGSGKTSSLVTRMVACIMSGKYKVNEIAAVTFTRKAASELRARFQNKLEKSYQEAETIEFKQRLEQALIDLDQCFLGTIHSFCAKLLRERPIEASIDPDFKEIDDLEEKVLLDQAWESYFNETKLNN